jgi:flagellar basal-body rod protein FlgC
MSLFNVFDITASAMQAQSVRLNVTASNLANADSVMSSNGETYRARHPVFQTVLGERLLDRSGAAPGGVRVAGIVESQAPLRREYRPDHPAADESGYVSLPNVSVVEEMANMIAASRSYQSNVEVFNASKQMVQQTLSLGK